MRRTLIVAGIVSAGLAITGTAMADDKKIEVGGDLAFMLPLNSDFSNGSGPLIGVVAKGGYFVTPQFEVTGRIGYLAGLSKSQPGGFSTSVSGVPLWLGVKYFFMQPGEGLYGAAELAFNFFNVNASADGVSASTGFTREGLNIGAGYVISRDLPIDIRAQLNMINLLGTESGESLFLGLLITAGYSVYF